MTPGRNEMPSSRVMLCLLLLLLPGCNRTGELFGGALAQASANINETNHHLNVRYGSCAAGYIMTSRGCEFASLRHNSKGEAFVLGRSGRWHRTAAYD
ncbi:MAG: hypothetical protein ACK40A_14470, partial [Pannonibacter indicus]